MLVTSIALLSAVLLVSAQQPTNKVLQNLAILSELPAASKPYDLKSAMSVAKMTTIPAKLAAMDTQSVTLFAATDAAFTALLTRMGGAVPTDQSVIESLLLYHVSPLMLDTNTVQSYQVVPTLYVPPNEMLGKNRSQVLGLAKKDNNVVVSYGLGTAKIIDSIVSSNGVIHVIDKVLSTPKKVSETAAAFNLTSFIAAVKKVNAADTLDNLKGATFLIPNDAAFERAKASLATLSDDQLKSVINYHVVPNNVVYSTPVVQGNLASANNNEAVSVTLTNNVIAFNNAHVVTADVFTNNGVIHVIDSVLRPGALGGTTSAPAVDPNVKAKDTKTTAGTTPSDAVKPTNGSPAPQLHVSGLAMAFISVIALLFSF